MRVEWRPAAEADLDAAIRYIQDQNPQAALKLAMALRLASLSLSDFAGRGRPGQSRNTRELIVMSNYVLTYEIDIAAQTVTILRLWHAAQNR